MTISYPFGRVSEAFLDEELPRLVRRFRRVILVPSRSDEHRRLVPAGVEIKTFLADASQRNGDVVRALFFSPARAVRQYGRALMQEATPYPYLWHPRRYVRSLGTNLLKYRLLKDFLRRETLQGAIVYDYWLENSTLALSWLRREGLVRRAVARAHGFDLYDERWEHGAVPFRAFKLASLDRVFPTSAYGLRYLTEKHPAMRSKLALSRVGVARQELVGDQHHQVEPLVVSCASLTPVKRVEFIPQVLARIGRPLRWVHFGEGPERGDVERAAAALPDHVSWELAGQVDRSEVLDYYRKHRADLFLSLSTSEGTPVSMMEAISFGIPILATAVGGVPEIVTASTGRLVGVDDAVDSIAAVAEELLGGNRPSSDEIVAFFEANFDAETNFGQFAETLAGL